MADTGLGRLSEEQWDELQDRADRFAEAAAADPHVDWGPFLPDAGDPLRLAVLHELVMIHLGMAWAAGVASLLEGYAARFPELGGPADWPASVVAEEYRQRHRGGDAPDVEEYRRRFPDRFGELSPLLTAAGPPASRTVTGTAPGRPPRPPVTPPAERGRVVGQGYELVERIGAGHFGEVWRALARGGVEVAVKVLLRPADEETARRELDALELVKSVRHPCLLSTHQFWPEEGRLYIVMELADGSLRDRFEDCRAGGLPGVPPEELIAYMRDAAEGLDVLHGRPVPVLHRDVKPDNILLLGGHAKLADFGLARESARRSATTSQSGTPVYMAPESWRRKAGPESDQYALAFTYAEMRTGRRPIDGDDFVEVMTRHLKDPPDLTGLPDGERAVLGRALAKERDGRFGGCLEFVAALEKALGPLLGAGPVRVPAVRRRGGSLRLDADSPTGPMTDDPPGRPRRRRRAAAAGLLLVAVIAAALVWPSPEGQTPRFTPAAGAATVTNPADGMRYYDRIVETRPDGVRAEYVLVRHSGDPFYILKHKVWRTFYDKTARPDRRPMADVTWGQARRLARRVGGELPTPGLWDAAAGFDPNGGDGPLPGGEGIAGGLSEPLPFDGLPDVPGGAVGMAGNGAEFTSATKERGGETLAVLRGRWFTLRGPLTHRMLAGQRHDPHGLRLDKKLPYVGFRVVLPASEGRVE